MKNNLLKASLIIVTGLVLHEKASAQKLPSEQKDGLFAPANVKIDGKTNEWSDKFQARNNATQLFYTLSNDADNLYLVMRTAGQSATDKIFYGGISLVISSRDKSKKLVPVKMTYPLVSLTERSAIAIPLRDKDSNTDSTLAAVNGAIGRSAKHIALAGFTDITDPDVSVYNDLGIKAACLADATRAVNFEFQLPIKYIKHLLNDSGSFDYSIIVNGAEIGANTVIVSGHSLGGGGGGAPAISISPANANPIFSPTDLKATYTLVKK